MQLLKEAEVKGRAEHEGWRLRKDGTKFWGSVVITALHNKKNELIGFSKVTRDLTERKLNEETLKQYTEKLERNNIELETVRIRGITRPERTFTQDYHLRKSFGKP
jgi:hypothetical protein